MDQITVDTTGCDVEPIHVPGSIQPHGILLVAEAASLKIVGFAGDATTIGGEPEGRALGDLLPLPSAFSVDAVPKSGLAVIGELVVAGTVFDAVAFRTGSFLAVELTGKDDGLVLDASFLAQLETLSGALERASSLADLFRQASRIFQNLTGYDRVMIYRFVDDDAGVVVGEALRKNVSSFMHHHFPASDIPRQARALYVRNRVRVIADVGYVPSPIRSSTVDLSGIDLSDSTLRSVSPIHVQYLRNMEVGASASVSIVKDGLLWGLVACHHSTSRSLSLTARLACQAVATSLARHVKSREESELYRERIRLRSQEDVVLGRLGSDETLDEFFAQSGGDLAALLQADGFAAVQGNDLFVSGRCPDPIDIRAVADHVRVPASIKPFATAEFGRSFGPARQFRETASGVLAVTMSTEVPTILMWFRAEQLQTVVWAGNPHKNAPLRPGEILRPRASFEAWSESVSGRSREWTHAEAESATRIVRLMLEARNGRRMAQLNRELATTLRENESLINQKNFLLKEVNHRVQNSLTLVSAFLRMQGRSASAEVRSQLEEAEHRLTAVSLVHRRLYQDDSVEIIDLSRYLGELCGELVTALDPAWNDHIVIDLAPILISTERAVSVGLILNELVINATKYAYGGAAGPLHIAIEQHRDSLRLIVADHGEGKGGQTKGTGFGTKMLGALVERLGGVLDNEDNMPGMRVIVTAPIRLGNETDGTVGA